MNPAKWLFWLRISAIVALTASAALQVDYSSPTATFCAAGSGCGAVRASGWGHLRIAGSWVPMPIFGLVGYGAVLVSSLFPRWIKGVVALSGFGGLVALALLMIQAAVIKRFCSLCVVTDLAGLAAAVCAIGFARQVKTEPGHAERPIGLAPWAWLALGVLGVSAPFFWGRLRPLPQVPSAILAYYEPGKINVVEFADFECPFCRLLHRELQPLLSSYADRIHFVRLQMPLESHPHARDAARTAICAELQGKGPEIAELLFEAQDLTPQANRQKALGLGLNLTDYDRCIAGGQADARIAQESGILRDAGFEGLPTLYLGSERIVGAQPLEVFRAALDRAEGGSRPSSLPAPAFVAGLLAFGLLIVGFGRTRGGGEVVSQREAPIGGEGPP